MKSQLRFFLVFLWAMLLGINTSALAHDYVISFDAPTASEGSVLTFTVTLDQTPYDGDVVTVSYATTAIGSATPGSDFNSIFGDLVFDGTSGGTQTFTVATNSDTDVEPDETIQIRFITSCPDVGSGGNPTCNTSWGGAATAIGTIIDDDHNITVTANASQREDAGNYDFVVAIAPPVTGTETVSVSYRTNDGTADGLDYTDTDGGPITFTNVSAGSVTVSVPVTDDATMEGDEEFDFELYSPSGNVESYDAHTTATILNDDYLITSTLADATVDENGAAPLPNNNELIYTITIDRIPTGTDTVTMPYSTADGSAVVGADYTAAVGNIVFDSGSGSVSQDITIPIVDDPVRESDEQFSLAIGPAGSNFEISGPTSANITIEDNDYHINISNDFSVDVDAGTADVLVILLPARTAGDTVTFDYTTTNGTATAGDDYTATSGTHSFSDVISDNPFTITVHILNDGTQTGAESFTLDLSNISTGNATFVDDQCEITINDHEFTMTAGNDVTESEDAGTATFTVTLDRNPVGGEIVTVDYTTAGGTATQGTDYTLTSGTLTIDATDPNIDKVIIVPILEDDIQELLEEYTVVLSNPSINTLINAGDEVTYGRISDNDYHVNAFADLAVDENAGMAQLTVTLGHNVAPGDSVDFTVSYAGGTPAATEGNSGDWDYTASQTALTIGPGTNSGTIDIPINDDAMVEPAEKFIVTLSPTSGNIDTSYAGAADLDAEVTINIDEKYHFSIDNVNVVEAETTVDFTVTLVSPTPLQSEHNGLDIYFSTQDDTAIDPDDYDAVIGGAVSFSDAADTQPITITIHDDTLDEGAAEQFLVNLTGASISEIVEFDVGQGTCTIQDTDYIITPSWNIHGSVTLESPVGTSRAITSGSAVAIDNNEQARFTVAADYRIHQVTIDGADPTTLVYVTVSVIDPANHVYTFEANTPQGARTIDVIFDHQIEMTAGSDGTITHTTGSSTSVHDGGPTAVIADHNEDESFLIEADTDYCVTNVEVDGSSLGAFESGSNNWHNDTYTFPNVTDNHAIIAEFGSATITVNLGADDGATGTDEDLFIQDVNLSGSGWRAYATDASYTASGEPFATGFHGESFTLPTDTPCDTQYILIQFLDVDGWLKPGDIELNLQDSFQDQTVEGLYDSNSHVLTIVAVNGSVNLDPVGEPAVGDERYLYPADTDVELTAVADADWYFYRWLGDVAEVPDPTALTITITMDRDRTVEAVFVQGCQDNDNDGYTTDDLAGLGCFVSPEIDCDDTNAEIFPGAEEICGDGIDQDCSGSDLVCSGDDDDNDGDGYTENQGDCDDTNAAIHPGAYDDPTTAADEDCFDGPREIGLEQLCVNASDVPANAARKPAPPMIMFLLDDSGSMDWEFMTVDTNQLFHGKYYVYDYHVNARKYNEDNRCLTDSQKREWLSQWAGYNRIYFDPNVNYAPWPKWEDVAANVTYSGSEAGAVTAHEFTYDADNTTFPDRAFVDGFTHADMDTPRLNTVDNGAGYSWNHTDDDGNVLRFNLNDEFMRVMAGGGQQVIVTRDNSSTGDSTIADAIGLSVRGDLELNVAHEWTWYNASNRPEIIFDDGDGDTVYSETDNWRDSGGGAEWEWAGQARWSGNVGEKAGWRLDLSNAQEKDYYVYAWMDDYGSRDDNALYSIFYYDGSGELQSAEFRIDQSPANSTGSPANGARWVRLSDTTYHFSEQSGTDEIIIPNAHYYTWNDVNNDGVLNWVDTDGDGKIDTSETLSEDIYLVTIPGSGHNPGDYELKYYLVNDVFENFQIEDGELIEKTGADIPVFVIPVRVDQAGNPITDADELAYVVRQDFADWFSFYRRRMLTAKAAVGLTVADMARVELGVHTINHTFHEPLVFIADGNSQEMIDYLTTIYNINPSGSTPLRRGLFEVGKYFEAGTSGDYTNLQTTEGLCAGDSSVFYDAQEEDDADTCDDSGGECQRAYVIAMTDGYYDSRTATVGNVDGSVEVVLRDAASNSMADISMLFYNSDLDTSLGDNVPAEGFDDATWQHMVTFTVSFGVFGHFNPQLFPDCLPGCETPGQAGCPELTDLGVAAWSGNPIVYEGGPGPFDDMCPDWHDNNPPATYSPNSVDDLFHASVNSRGKFLNAANPAELVAAMQTIKDLIADQTGTASSVAINARKIQEDTLLFQTIYDSGDWGGDVLAKCLDLTGEIAACGRVNCESGCNSAYESCMGLCSVGDTTCQEVCVDSRQTCLTTNSCSDHLTCNEAHVDCINACGGDAGCEAGCDNTRTSCQDDPPEVQWSATQRLDLVTAASRRIITADITDDNSDGKLGIAFQWSALPATMKTSLQGEFHILDYLRGDRQYERQNDTGNVHNYRNRSGRLGDFINSEPYHYANSSLGIDWVFSGANDGMLHVFDGQTGDEVFAYIPNMSFDNLHLLSQETYNDNHKFYVDGYLTVKDLGDRVILIGGMGKGGKGYYALDLTAAAGSSDIEADAADIVLWEYSQATMIGDADIVANLGYSFSRPQIVPSNDTSANWLLIFGNGYESNNLRSVLFLVGMKSFGNIQWTRMIDSGTGDDTDCNGLSTPAIIYPQGDGRNDFIFAGDLLGNLWKFDINDADKDVWDSYFNDGSDPQPLFQARSNAGYRQPITMKPAVTTSCAIDVPGYMVAFGTGRLLNPDVDAPDTSVQSVYGIWDWSAAWKAEGAANPEQTYLGYFEPETGASTASCSASCSAILGDDLTAGTCIFDCRGNTECEDSCHQERASCVANCSAVRTLSHMDMVIGDATAADYVALLRQTQVYVGGIDYAADGTIREQKYGETDLDAWDQIVRVMSDNEIDWLFPAGKDDFIADTNKLVKHAGWYFDLPVNGERIVRDMTIANHKLIFTSTIPTDSPCESGGTSHHWAVEVCSGSRTNAPFFDVNDDGVISGGDYILIGTADDSIWVPTSSFQEDGLSPAPILIEGYNTPDRLHTPSGQPPVSGFGIPIQYWRELNWQ